MLYVKIDKDLKIGESQIENLLKKKKKISGKPISCIFILVRNNFSNFNLAILGFCIIKVWSSGNQKVFCCLE